MAHVAPSNQVSTIGPRMVTRLCLRTGCGKVLTGSQKKFCSHTCRNLVHSPGNSGGAPVKYLPEYATIRLEEYLAVCDEGNKPSFYPKGNTFVAVPNAKLPSMIGYARHLGFSRQTLENWAGQFPEFARALDLLKDVQQEFLVNNGLSGRYNSSIAKLMLEVNHGFVEKEDGEQNRLVGVFKRIYDRSKEL